MVSGEQLVSAPRFCQRQPLSDHRLDLALYRHLGDLTGDRGDACAFGVVEIHEKQRGVFGQCVPDRDLALRRRALPGAHDSPALGEEPHVGGQIDADNELVHQIGAYAAGELEGAGNDVLGAVVDGRFGAEAADERRFGGALHGTDDVGAERDGQLHRSRAHAARRALYEHRLAGLQGAARDESVVGGGECHAQGGGIDKRETGRYGHGLRLGDKGVLGVAPLAADAEATEEHLVSRLDGRDVGADLLDHTGAVGAECLRRLFRRGEAVLAHGHVDGVHRGRFDAHQDLSRAGLRGGDLFVHQDLGPTILMDTYRLHHCLLRP